MSAGKGMGGKSMPMNGVTVHFPFETPYKAQVQMMVKIIGSLKNKQNALLESPTGSGKSLALLCSSLAWLQVKIDVYETKFSEWQKEHIRLKAQFHSFEKANVTIKSSKNPAETSAYFQKSPAPPDKLEKIQDQINKHLENKPKRNYPCIYYGTRTHRQIKQIVKELGRTKYANSRMTVLGSRSHYCVNSNAKKSAKGVNEGCAQLLSGRDPMRPNAPKSKGCLCIFKTNLNTYITSSLPSSEKNKKPVVNKLPYPALRHLKVADNSAWDIEDLITTGHEHTMCPFYLSRAVRDECDIVFCPYNYLIDPNIRKSMKINLENQIVILDEAHNVENTSRESASLENGICEYTNMLGAIYDGEKHWRDTPSMFKGYYEELISFIRNLHDYMESAKVQKGLEEKDGVSKIWLSTLLPEELELLWLTPKKLSNLEQSYTSVTENAEALSADSSDSPLSSRFYVLLGCYLTVARYIVNGPMGMGPYRLLLIKERYNEETHSSKIRLMETGLTPGTFPEFYYEMKFICMSPAVAFQDMKVCHSILLTSGTLSPLDTFASELGTEFAQRLEAAHVIQPDQVFCRHVGVLGGVTLKAVYTNWKTDEFVNTIGQLVMDVTDQVQAGGILVFFPSYGNLRNSFFTWKKGKTKSLFTQMKKKAKIFEESNKGSDDFNSLLQKFTETCKSGGKALLFAVMRGKVSEGIDFPDNAARAVITVGIPFPAMKDPVTEMKQEYNDHINSKETAVEKRLVSGKRWYQIQAFRALNQALGRCIRHSRDWGAIILVDERWGGVNYFHPNKEPYLNDVSKWLRTLANPVPRYDQFINDLRDFQKVNKERTELELNEEMSVDPVSKAELMDTSSSNKMKREKENIPIHPLFKLTAPYKEDVLMKGDIMNISDDIVCPPLGTAPVKANTSQRKTQPKSESNQFVLKNAPFNVPRSSTTHPLLSDDEPGAVSSDNSLIAISSENSPILTTTRSLAMSKKYTMTSSSNDDIPSETKSPPKKKLNRTKKKNASHPDQLECDCGNLFGRSAAVVKAPFFNFEAMAKLFFGPDITKLSLLKISQDEFLFNYPKLEWTARYDRLSKQTLSIANCASGCTSKILYCSGDREMYCYADVSYGGPKVATSTFGGFHCLCGKDFGTPAIKLSKPPFSNFQYIAKALQVYDEKSQLLKIANYDIVPPTVNSQVRYDPDTRQAVCKVYCSDAACDASFLYCINDSSLYYYYPKP